LLCETVGFDVLDIRILTQEQLDITTTPRLDRFRHQIWRQQWPWKGQGTFSGTSSLTPASISQYLDVDGKRVVYDDTPTEFVYSYYKSIDVVLRALDAGNFMDILALVVLEEYELLKTHLDSLTLEASSRKCAIVTGQPGIGEYLLHIVYVPN
jgi:hypothetical protein